MTYDIGRRHACAGGLPALRPPPVEATIAPSIVLVAGEAVHAARYALHRTDPHSALTDIGTMGEVLPAPGRSGSSALIDAA